MNRLIVAITLIATSGFQGFSQGIGSFEFMNVGVPADRLIYVDQYLVPGQEASGSGYKIAVYYGPAGTTDEHALILGGAPTVFLDPPGGGQFNGGARTLTGLTEDGAVVAIQARAWDVSTGATWEEAAANPNGRVGKGPVFEMALKDPTQPLDPLPRLGYAAGWQGFAITPVPEPSVWGLAGVGIATLLFFRRRH
ncbi:MAG TPA: PEP-CTERM sorting domain-containing protein [Verrucomicrobiae bacterium]|nr:PEP-CTERM sorting domain-containing protein [Verrucomicrobiae bacterium]